jgi:hypothetical protein
MTWTTRILPRDEWHRVEHTNAAGLWQQAPDSTCVIVVERGGEIVGSDLLLPVLHAECLWVHPDHRGKTAVARRLWPAIQEVARDRFGVRSFAAVGVSKEMGQLLSHLNATRLRGENFLVPVGGG